MAGITTTSTVSSEFQTYYTNYLLKHAIQLLVLDQFADMVPFPKNAGAKTIRFFKKSVADASQVQSLTEGTAPSSSTYRQLTLTPIDVTLAQYGQVAAVTDVLTWTDKLRILKETIGTMIEDCALKADTVIRNEIIATNISDAAARSKDYAGTATDFASLGALNQQNGAMTGTDVLNCLTSLKLNRALQIGGEYVGIIPPQVTRDLMTDAKWLTLAQYSQPERLIKGEVGKFYGCKIVEATNPFIEDVTNGAEGTYGKTSDGSISATANDLVFASFFTGKGAYGCPVMAGQSPFSPKVIMVDTADHSDPLLQQTLAGWKGYWAAKLYQSNWLVVFRSKSVYGN
jgi:N4-gp56 family major capsid protein